EVQLPYDVYYGAQTQRAVDNFPISGRHIAPELIHALGLVKWAAAKANDSLGLLGVRVRHPLSRADIDALIQAAWEVGQGKFDGQFPIDVYQTGSGTSSNMNTNEVIANRAMELAGYDRFSQNKVIHPNDHVNCGQSTNDIFPTAIHVAAAQALQHNFIPALNRTVAILKEKSVEWQHILKIGRTHLADATPMTLGQEIGGMSRQAELSVSRCEEAIRQLSELPVGGTAVGTGINTASGFGGLVCSVLAETTGIGFVEAADHFEANAQRDGLVAAHALLKTIATSLHGIANNIRWLSSGPRCGFHEIRLADLQPGSSIMPGKVNPVLCESLMQVCVRVAGNDQTMTLAGTTGGQFQLNIMMPVMADTMLESIRILTGAINVFNEKCLLLMQADKEQCNRYVEQSLSMATGLNLFVGYEQAAGIAKKAYSTGKTVRQLCQEEKLLVPEQLEQALDPWRMTKPMT
ncbi:MAG: class II fumarate hydratase, partial [Thermoguttaceae bacterium]|nr:class II fumarate hydratase [Thermoguttaceae bacterium]